MPPKDGLPSNFTVFLYYFVPSILFILIMLNRTILLKLVLNTIDAIFDPIRVFVVKLDKKIQRTVDKINEQEFVFFTKGDIIATLNRVMLYITKNEHTKKIKIVHVLYKGEEIQPNLAQEIDFLNQEYPEIEVEFVVVNGAFSPQLIRKLSKDWNIPINFMFIGSPGNKFPYKIEDLGGVRLII